VSDISRAYGFDEPYINKLVRSEYASALYEEIKLPKKNPARANEYRIVYKTKYPSLALLQKNIATSVSAKWTFPDYVQGFVGKRSIATNASLHLAKDYILKADIVGFFEAITFKQVVEVFKRLGWALQRLCTVK